MASRKECNLWVGREKESGPMNLLGLVRYPEVSGACSIRPRVLVKKSRTITETPQSSFNSAFPLQRAHPSTIAPPHPTPVPLSPASRIQRLACRHKSLLLVTSWPLNLFLRETQSPIPRLSSPRSPKHLPLAFFFFFYFPHFTAIPGTGIPSPPEMGMCSMLEHFKALVFWLASPGEQ